MRAIDKKVLRDLGHLKGQVVAIALVIALPFVLFALFDYPDLMARAALPTAGAASITSRSER